LILQSPAATDPEKEAERQFVLNEIEDVKANIAKSRDEMRQLDDVISKLASARQIQDSRDRQQALQAQITTWQATYAQLLTNLQRGTPNYLSVVEPAQAAGRPVNPGTGSNVLLGLAIGLALSTGAAFLLEYIDDTVKTPEDVRQTLGLAVLGSIPRLDGKGDSRQLVVADQPRSPMSGAYRVLRTNLQFCSVDFSLNTLMVTSASPGEGKSVIAANLAAAMAQSGKQVILVDADLWRPVQHRVFQLDNRMGLTALLKGDVNLNQALQAVPLENLHVLPSGPIPPNPSDLLGSRRMGDLVETLQQRADLVIFDSPPVMADADATILATHVDGVLLVIDSGTTRRALARRCREALGAVGAYLPGVALNRVPEASRSYYYYDYAKQERRSWRETLATKLKQKLRAMGPNSRSTERPDAPAGHRSRRRPGNGG
jgi:non-specific protein-tyrosine kinase